MLAEPRKDTFVPAFYTEYFENLALGFKPYRCACHAFNLMVTKS